MIMLRCAFLARLLLVGWGLFHMRFGERWRRRLLLLQLLDALVSGAQLLFEDVYSLQGLLQFIF